MNYFRQNHTNFSFTLVGSTGDRILRNQSDKSARSGPAAQIPSGPFPPTQIPMVYGKLMTPKNVFIKGLTFIQNILLKY